MSLSMKEKPSYYSQKTSSTCQKTEHQSFHSVSYFFGSLLGCYTTNNRMMEVRSFHKANPQTIQNLMDVRHYTDRMFDEKQPCLACKQASSESKAKEISSPSFNIFERLPGWRILLYGGKVLVARFTIKSAKINKLPLNSEKRRRISVNSSKEGPSRLDKEDYHKDELNNTCTNATHIFQSEISRVSNNPSLASCKGVHQSLHQDFMNFESRNGKLLYRIAAHVARKAGKFGNLVLDATASSGITSLQVP